MKVLQVHNRYRRPGGEDAVVRAEGELLRDAGHEVLTWFAENPPEDWRAAGRLALAPWNAASARAIAAFVRKERPDVAHVHNTWFSLTPAVITAIHDAGVPVVLTLHNFRLLCANSQLFRAGGACELCIDSHPWHGVVHRCYNRSLVTSIPAAATIASNRRRGTWTNGVSAFLALTRFARNRFVAGGLPAERIHIKPHFVHDPGERAALPSSSQEILFVGRLAKEKGVWTALEVMRRVADTDLQLLFVGDGDQYSQLRRQAGPNVGFAGHLDHYQVRQRMLGARALLFPSIAYETFGLSMVEAMAAGIPVLASDLGGTADILGEAAGRLVPPRDVDAWEQALRTFVLDPSAIDAAGASGRRRWRQRYSPEAALPLLEESYQIAIDHEAGL
jgi:glycosyltransferase involved in cell wall biosynthesis